MKPGRCAYCGRNGALSKEELFPKFLAHKIGYRTVVDRRRGPKPLRMPPVLRDVCKDCNNVALGSLDAYASELTKEYFLVPISSPVEVKFKYRFDLLHRWLLKMSYNFARATGHRTDVFQDHLAYILGERDDQEDRSVLLIGVFEASRA